MVCTDVPKSVTSRRRCRFLGNAVLTKSTIIDLALQLEIDADGVVGQIDHDAAFTGIAAAEIDIAQRMS